MSDAPIRVEADCSFCDGRGRGIDGMPGCTVCDATGVMTFAIRPDSLAARQIELAVACVAHTLASEALDTAFVTEGPETVFVSEWGAPSERRKAYRDSLTKYRAALKAVREHPDHRPANTGGDDAV